MGSKFSIEQITTKLSRTIAHHFEFKFLPAQHGLLDQGFVNRAGIEGVRNRFGKFLAIVGDRTARPAQRERRPDHHRIPELIRELQRVLRIVHQRRRGNIEPDFANGILEPQAVFGNLDGAQRGADQLDAIFFEDSAFRQLDGQIQARLPAHGGQQRLRPFHGNNLFEVFLRQRLDIGAVGDFGIGHDRRRV